MTYFIYVAYITRFIYVRNKLKNITYLCKRNLKEKIIARIFSPF
jgi:hypothetical protein